MRKFFTVLVVALTIAVPVWARDPFRSGSPKARAIGTETFTAFETLFRDGNYRAAIPQVQTAVRTNSEEPLAHTMLALIHFFEKDYNSMRTTGRTIRERAQRLMNTDKLRGHLYTAVGDLVEASFLFKTEGVSGVPKILPLVQNVLTELRNARAVDPTDPELNLLQGLIDILISSASSAIIPSSDVERSLVNLRQYSAPEYLRWGGVAVAYRDAKQPAPALEAVDRALAIAPQNPILHYFKGQILWIKGDIPEARRHYLLTLSRAPQLPNQFIKDVMSECRVLTGRAEDCQVLPR